MKQFFLLVAFIVISLCSNCQIVYTDINPDYTVFLPNGNLIISPPGSSGTISISYEQFEQASYFCCIKTTGGIEIPYADSLDITWGLIYFTPKFSFNDTITDNGIWAPSWSSAFRFYTHGFWNYGDINEYLGFRFPEGNSYRYGWLRLDFISGSVTGKDFAINTSSEPFIIAGDGLKHRCTNVQITDINDYNDGRDIQLNCYKAMDETGIEEYSLYLVKSGNAESFDLDAALNVPNGNYYSVLPNYANPSVVFESETTDVDGDLISHDFTYNAFVLSYMESGNEELAYLSDASNTLQLYSYSNVEDIIGSDIGNEGNGTDLLVSFTKAENENGVAKYRIMLVDYLREIDHYNQDPFTLAIADTIPEENYHTVIPNGQDVSVMLDANSRDVNGLLLGTGTYKIYVLVVSNGTTTNTNSLSEGNGLVSLTNPSDRFIIAGQNSGSGIVYTDLEPGVIYDLNIYPAYYNFDLNGNLESDFLFRYEEQGSGSSGFFTEFTKLFSKDHSYAITNQLASGCVINHRLPWSQDLEIPLIVYSYDVNSGESGSGGYWINWDRGYLALKMIHVEDTLYGYIDMQLLPGGDELKIYGYAYFDPSSLSINETSQFVNVYPNPTSGITQINLNDKICLLDIYDMSGRLIESEVIDNPTTNIFHDFSEYKKGLYLLKISNSNNLFFTSKIVVR